MLPRTILAAPSSGSSQAESLVAEQVDAGVHSGRIVTCSFSRLGQGHVETKRLALGVTRHHRLHGAAVTKVRYRRSERAISPQRTKRCP